MAKGPRILLLDIETLPNEVYSWGLKVDGWLDYENIKTERYICCASWMFLDEDEVHSEVADIGHGKFPDLRVLKALKKAINKADAVVAHNGNHFDIPWVLARMLLAGMKPPKPFIPIDTKEICARKFYLNSNRLGYVAAKLGVGKKIPTTFGLWLGVMRGSKKALRKMVTYNKQDVRVLKGVYLKVAPYVAAKLNRALFAKDDKTAAKTCPTCGGVHLIKHGFSYTRTTIRQNFQCKDCGAWCYKVKNSKLPR